MQRVFTLVNRLHAAASLTVSTAELNRVLREAVERNPPPLIGNRPVRIYYGVQKGILPPRFLLFSNRPDAIDVPYKRFLVKRLREAFGFEGSPVWLEIRGRGRSSRHEPGGQVEDADAAGDALDPD